MFAAWMVFLFVPFGVSVLTLTYVQTRAAKKDGWRALRERPLHDTYWAALSLVERAFLWPGIIAFFLTLLSATGWKVVSSLG